MIEPNQDSLDGLLAFARRVRLAEEAPAMFEALRLCERALEERDAEAEEYAAKNARAVLERIDNP